MQYVPKQKAGHKKLILLYDMFTRGDGKGSLK